MCALRWGKTLGSYNKYKSLFREPFPSFYKTNSPLPQANYIRDALRFASEKGFPGGSYYGRLKVTAEENGVRVSLRNSDSAFAAVRSLPEETVFSLMRNHKNIAVGYQFVSSDPIESLQALLEPLGFDISLVNNVYKIIEVSA